MKHSNTPLEVQIPFLKGGSPAYNYYIFDSPTHTADDDGMCIFAKKKNSKQNKHCCMHSGHAELFFVNSHKQPDKSKK